ncbi:hypothetical protein WSS_A27735 [Rhodococcus opacus M213]|uniref:Uncharacterized protein n=1 Tax=Rhodococcus opacus M213 TaxID=1129896 RepID=K8XD21_RHOOP|nr:hypothetical protein WSS_A27735 [Rhodococcus opacus M213]
MAAPPFVEEVFTGADFACADFGADGWSATTGADFGADGWSATTGADFGGSAATGAALVGSLAAGEGGPA